MGRALAVDGMRRAGRPVLLSVLGLSYQVFIRTFTFNPGRNGFEITYEIALEVLIDSTQGLLAGATTSIDILIANDMATAAAFLL